MAKVSVIVPIYNVEKYLSKCLDSLVNQTLEDIEIILVNDGSTDSSKKIAEDYKNKYKNKNIVYVEKENGGLSDARNYGMKYANGEYIAFLDSDDFCELELYEKMYNKAIEEKADYVECDFYWSYPKKSINKLKENITLDEYKKIFNNKIDKGIRYKDKSEMFIFARVVAWNKLIKKDIIKEQFPVGLKYEDVEFFYKLLPNIKKFAFVEEPLIYYVQRESSLVNKQDYTAGQIFNVLNNVIDFYKQKNLFDKYKNELEYTYARILLCSSFKRIKKIQDKVARNKLLYETWQNLNTKFPDWRKNEILKQKSLKNKYMRTINKNTYKFYCKF